MSEEGDDDVRAVILKGEITRLEGLLKLQPNPRMTKRLERLKKKRAELINPELSKSSKKKK